MDTWYAELVFKAFASQRERQMSKGPSEAESADADGELHRNKRKVSEAGSQASNQQPTKLMRTAASCSKS